MGKYVNKKSFSVALSVVVASSVFVGCSTQETGKSSASPKASTREKQKKPA